MTAGLARRVVTAAALLTAATIAPATASAATTTVSPAADAYVDQAYAAKSFGVKTSLLTSPAAGAEQDSYLRFDVAALSGPVLAAKLRLYAPTAATSAPALAVVSGDWTEGGLSWNTRPTTLGTTFAAPGAIAAGSWVEYDVTAAITATGSYSFQLAGSAASFKSREVANAGKRPQLVIETGGAVDSTPPSVSFVTPSNDAQVSGHVSVTASASDLSGVQSVDLSVDGVSQASDRSTPYSYDLDTSTLADGPHTLTARAVDTAGNEATTSQSLVVGNSPAPAACDWYAAPNGSTSNSGRSTSSPLTITAAVAKPAAGEVVCLMAGTYNVSSTLYLTKSGSAGHDVVYRSYGGAAVLRRTAGGSTYEMFKLATGARFVTVDGLTLDGAGVATNGILCSGTSHLRAVNNIVENTGSGGVVSVGCDYLTVDNNRFSHVGYGRGWSSAISINTAKAADSAPGFHSYVTRNIIGGTDDNSGKNTDGNGIILDLGGNTPAVLVANNLGYMNYARCIHSYHVSHVWVINNTCYKNAMREPHSTYGTGEISFSYCNGCYALNNVVQAWTYGNPYRVENSSPIFSHNLYFGGKANMVPASIGNDSSQLRGADPLFSNPVAVNDTAASQWRSAPQAWTLGLAFAASPGSPLINGGVDPHTLPALTADLRTGFDAVMGTDLAGHPRVNGGWDIGAYEH